MGGVGSFAGFASSDFFGVLAAGTSSSSLSGNSTIFGPDSAFFAFRFLAASSSARLASSSALIFV